MEKKLPFIYWMIFIAVVGIIFIIVMYYAILASSDTNFSAVSLVRIRSNIGKIINSEKINDNIERKAILSLSPQKEESKIGNIFPVEILLDTKDFEIDGVDVFLKYDPKILEISGKEGSRIRIGNIFENFMGSEINKETGLIKFSALSKPKEKFQGQGKIATINFKSLEEGMTKISFIFERGLTTDTNVSRKGEDVLLDVVDGEYIIK